MFRIIHTPDWWSILKLFWAMTASKRFLYLVIWFPQVFQWTFAPCILHKRFMFVGQEDFLAVTKFSRVFHEFFYTIKVQALIWKTFLPNFGCMSGISVSLVVPISHRTKVFRRLPDVSIPYHLLLFLLNIFYSHMY